MRLIDADAMLENEFEAYMAAQLKADYLTTQINEVVHRKIQKLILDTPSVESEPVKRGKWEICCDGYYPYCSNCKSEPQGRVMTDFCPNCGVRMDGKGDENEQV